MVIFVLQKSSKGQDLIDRICEQVDLVEKDYYGLVYVDMNNCRNWLAGDKKITKQLKCNANNSISCCHVNTLLCYCF